MLRLAEYYEKTGAKLEAAHFYNSAQKYEKSVSLYIECNYFLEAADICFRIGDYQQALDLYYRHGKSELKIADTLVKLGKYQMAAEIYRKKNQPKKYRDTLKKQMLTNREKDKGLFD
ncbi:MAG: tetratricopeptide repeat protein [Ignavibacteriales bacterium]|nr:tetratricopeptide repeat protein [Ignavibacteriales bacterium]